MGIVQNTGTPIQLWTTQYLSDLASEAEVQISTSVPCIYVRFPLSITAATSVYDFEDLAVVQAAQRLTGIIRITWQGWTVHPVFQNQLRNIVVPFKPENGDVISSRPFMYMRTGYGTNGIKFYPAPSANIPYDLTDINTQSGISNNVIVSGWRIADPTSQSYRLPNYIRETLVRYYVMKRAYLKEGKGQNLDASRYYEVKYNKLLERYRKIVMQLFTSKLRNKQDAFLNTHSYRPPRPRLPSNFGYPLEPYGEF